MPTLVELVSSLCLLQCVQPCCKSKPDRTTCQRPVLGCCLLAATNPIPTGIFLDKQTLALGSLLAALVDLSKVYQGSYSVHAANYLVG